MDQEVSTDRSVAPSFAESAARGCRRMVDRAMVPTSAVLEARTLLHFLALAVGLHAGQAVRLAATCPAL